MRRTGLTIAATLIGACFCIAAAHAEPAAGRTSWPAAVVAANAGPGAGPLLHRNSETTHTPHPIPPLPERKPVKGARAKTTTEAVPEVWTPQEIAAAKAHCAALLKTVKAVTLPHPPIKDGKCGAPAPIRLVSLGTAPQVAFSPPALVDCDMVGALSTWIEKDMQPLAKRHLGERIAKVEVISDYSCRASTGRGNRLSQHAFADALDIRGFVTESGRTARVLASWGETQRDVDSRIAAAKAKADEDKDRKPDASAPAAKAEPGERLKLAVARLGGPQSAKTTRRTNEDRPARVAALAAQAGVVAATPAGADDPKSRFLRAAHAAACRIFGTTLGPEANEAHRNHFHVDMAKRKYKKYQHICD